MPEITASLNQAHLGNNELCILWAIQLQLLGDVRQGDAGIGEADHAHTWEEGSQGGQGGHRPFTHPDSHSVVPAPGEAKSQSCSTRAPSDPDPHLSFFFK